MIAANQISKQESGVMPVDPQRLLAFCNAIDEAPFDRLTEIDRDTLIGIRRRLAEHKRAIDGVLERLSFLDEAPH